MRLCFALGIALLCSGCVRQDKPSAASIIRSAETAWRQGDFLTAAAAYEQATDAAPHAFEPYYDLALAYYRDKLYDMAAQYLGHAEPSATGELHVRCLLLHGDVEYRLAMQKQSEEHFEGLERALHFYREAAASAGSPLSATARYNVEVVKLKLPAAHPEDSGLEATSAEVDDTSAEDISFKTRMAAKDQNQKSESHDRDW